MPASDATAVVDTTATHFLRRGGASLASCDGGRDRSAGLDVDAGQSLDPPVILCSRGPPSRSASTRPQKACLRGAPTQFWPVLGRFGPTRTRVGVAGRMFASVLTTQYANLQGLLRERRDSNPRPRRDRPIRRLRRSTTLDDEHPDLQGFLGMATSQYRMAVRIVQPAFGPRVGHEVLLKADQTRGRPRCLRLRRHEHGPHPFVVPSSARTAGLGPRANAAAFARACCLCSDRGGGSGSRFSADNGICDGPLRSGSD